MSLGRIGVTLPRNLPADQFLSYARKADRLGFDELWVVEDLGFRGGLAQAGAALAATERVRVGIGILPAGARNVAFAAMELATLEQLFPGRVIGGIGHGMPDWMRSVGAWPASPLSLLGEYTRALRELMRGRPGPAAGKYVQVPGVQLVEVPAAAPPVLLGVRGPRSLALAGDVADGILLAEPGNPAYVQAARRAAGMGPDDPRAVSVYDVAEVSDDSASAVAAVRPALEWIGEPDWTPHIAPLPFAQEFTQLRARSGSREEFVQAMPDEWVRQLALAGTADEVAQGVRERHAAGATSVVFLPAAPDPLAALDRLARVLPRQGSPV